MSLLFSRARSMNLEPQSTNCTEWLLAARSFRPVLTCSMAGVNLQQQGNTGISPGYLPVPAMSVQLPAWAQVGLLQCKRSCLLLCNLHSALAAASRLVHAVRFTLTLGQPKPSATLTDVLCGPQRTEPVIPQSLPACSRECSPRALTGKASRLLMQHSHAWPVPGSRVWWP